MKKKPHLWAIPFTVTVEGIKYVEGSRKDAEREAKRLQKEGIDLSNPEADTDESTSVKSKQIKDLGVPEWRK